MSEEDPRFGDPTRRTYLAGERTYLAWWRTGLAAVAIAIAVGRLLPEVLGASTTWPYVVLGSGYAVIGIVIPVYAVVRKRSVDRALDRGGYRHASSGLVTGLGVAAAVLAGLTLLLIVATP